MRKRAFSHDGYEAAIKIAGSQRPNWSEYRRLIENAARAGNWTARSHLANTLLYGSKANVAAPRRAVALFRDVAVHGNPNERAIACFQLGCCYDDGLGVRRDYAEALRWSKRAARGGVAPAMINIASLEEERGNISAQRKWLRKAIAQRVEDGEWLLASSYLEHRALRPQLAWAIRFLKTHARRRNLNARRRALEMLEKYRVKADASRGAADPRTTR